MYTVKRLDTNEYLITESKWGAQCWSQDINDAVLFKRKSTVDRRTAEFNDLDNFKVEPKYKEFFKAVTVEIKYQEVV